MTRFRLLVALPLVFATAFLVGQLLLYAGPHHSLLLRIEVELVKLLSLIGSLAAALKFERGAYLRRAWLFVGGCMALLLLRDLTLTLSGLKGLSTLREVLSGSLSILANLSGVIGTWMLARAWRVAGIELPGSRWKQAGILLAAAVLALAFAGPGVVTNAVALVKGSSAAAAAVMLIASGLGDTISLCLIAPLLLTALALRGGLLGWPWALMTTSLIAWLGYDATLVLGPWLGAGDGFVQIVSEVFRSLGCLFGFSAGLAQRWVVAQIQTRRSQSC